MKTLRGHLAIMLFFIYGLIAGFIVGVIATVITLALTSASSHSNLD